MLAGDIVIADRSTKFLTAYASVGLTPDCGVSWLLPRVVGQQRALRMALSADPIDGDTALEWGLVTELVDGDPRERARELAISLANGPAASFGQARRLMRSSWSVDRSTSGADEVRTIADAVLTPEAQALIDVFRSR
jgi:2-(1,2-epoxy-1,2-dihydrophenyl)acetyl-CoA isomerase